MNCLCRLLHLLFLKRILILPFARYTCLLSSLTICILYQKIHPLSSIDLVFVHIKP